MIDHRLTLDYALHPGWLQPWIDGLRRGLAVGFECQACQKTSFPPERCCSCGHDKGEWKVLGGKAGILFRSEGLDGAFGLVRFDGADTATTARLLAVPPDAECGWLQPCPDGLPVLAIGPQKPGTTA